MGPSLSLSPKKNIYIYIPVYPLVNVYTTMETHHFSWVNERPQWPFSKANWYHRVPQFMASFGKIMSRVSWGPRPRYGDGDIPKKNMNKRSPKRNSCDVCSNNHVNILIFTLFYGTIWVQKPNHFG